jgi:hypothetical protein
MYKPKTIISLKREKCCGSISFYPVSERAVLGNLD